MEHLFQSMAHDCCRSRQGSYIELVMFEPNCVVTRMMDWATTLYLRAGLDPNGNGVAVSQSLPGKKRVPIVNLCQSLNNSHWR